MYLDAISIGIGLLLVYLVIRKAPSKEPTARKPRAKPDTNPEGLVYVISNPSFRKGILKIGLTTRDVSVRLSELRTTGVPAAFETCMILRTDDCKSLEKSLHSVFSAKRLDRRREFFELSLEDIRKITSDHSEKITMYCPITLGRALGVPVEGFKELH